VLLGVPRRLRKNFCFGLAVAAASGENIISRSM
jgi:hypothetical protein